jgi:hypothetical protein
MLKIIKKYDIAVLALILIVLSGAFWLQLERAQEKESAVRQVVAGATQTIQAVGLDPTSFGLPATSTEVLTERTDRTATFQIGPNRFAQVSYDGSLYARDQNGNLVPVSETGNIVDGQYVFDRLPDNIKISFDLTKPSYTLQENSHTITVTFNAPGTGYVEGDNTVMYRLGPNVVLRWKVVGGNVEKFITVEREGELPDLSFSIVHSADLKTVEKDSVLDFEDASGNIVFHTQQPFLTDGAGNRLPEQVTLAADKDSGAYSYSYSTASLQYPYIIDPTLGANAPGTVVNTTGVGTAAWTNPTNAEVADGVNATVPVGVAGKSNYLAATNFGFSVPTGSTIQGIATTVLESGGTNLYYDNIIELIQGGTIQGNNEARSSSTYWPPTLTLINYGGATDLWGLTWTVAQINSSNFGFAVSVAHV